MEKTPLEVIGAALAEAAYDQDQAEAAFQAGQDSLEELNQKCVVAAGRVAIFCQAYLACGGEPGKFTGKGPDGKEITVSIPKPTARAENGRISQQPVKSGGKHGTQKAR
jgi:hypothetical protein